MLKRFDKMTDFEKWFVCTSIGEPSDLQIFKCGEGGVSVEVFINGVITDTEKYIVNLEEAIEREVKKRLDVELRKAGVANIVEGHSLESIHAEMVQLTNLLDRAISSVYGNEDW